MEIIFWIIFIVSANWGFALLRGVLQPNWYNNKAIDAGVQPNFTRFIVLKIIQLGLCLWSLSYLGNELGY